MRHLAGVAAAAAVYIGFSLIDGVAWIVERFIGL